MAMAQKQLKAERQTQVAEIRRASAEATQAKIELDAMKAQSQYALQSDQQDLKEAQFAHKKNIDEGELQILKTTEDLRGIVSPTG